MKKVIIIVGLLALGAAGWAVYGTQIADKACDVKNNVQSEVHDKAQDVVDSIKPGG